MVIKEFWDGRYSEPDYAYGKEPNVYFKEQLSKLKSGKLLLPAEGEGRNAVYAAKQGWNVDAFDWSEEAKKKAITLATENKVTINYQVGDLNSIVYKPEEFDVIGLTYAHFTTDSIAACHRKLITYLRKGGIVIFEAFSKNHIKYNSENKGAGGPKNPDMLFTIEDIAKDFEDFDVIELIEKEIYLKEGLYHNGIGSVIRFTGSKK